MTGSEFNSLSGNGGGAHAVSSVATGLIGENSDWDTTATGLEGLFQDGTCAGVGYSVCAAAYSIRDDSRILTDIPESHSSISHCGVHYIPY